LPSNKQNEEKKMKAIVYKKAHPLNQFALEVAEVATPHLLETDVLVKIKAIGFNPVDYKIRQNRSASAEKPVVLGWDAAGVIEKVGSRVANFKAGDEVYYAGDLTRDGSYAELQAVDSRLIALKPKSLSFAEAAALPLTAITSYEALILQTTSVLKKGSTVLIIGGAGGVGSMSIQLLKNLTDATVIATASREASAMWCKKLGADHVIDHAKDLREELKRIGVGEVDFVFCTTQTAHYYTVFPELIRPFGHLTLIDDPATFELKPFKTKSIYVNFEFMFTKSMYKFEMESQGALLKHVAELVDAGQLQSTLQKKFEGLSVQSV
jgi:NADPH:quinone reductase